MGDPADAQENQLPRGTLLDGRYVVEERIGAGGTAIVYRALDRSRGDQAAIKVMRTAIARTEEIEARLRREAELLAKLDHPAIVQFRSIGRTPNGTPYIALEHLVGHSLSAVLRAHGPLDVQASARVVTPVCAALYFAHQHKVIHRDLKPENIVIVDGPQGQTVKVLDFGVSKALDLVRLTMSGEVLGTPRYMAPEQLAGANDLDERVDVYALGVVLFECLVGRSPFDVVSASDLIVAILHGRRLSIQAVAPQIPAAIASVVESALSTNRDQRPVSAPAFADAFLRALPPRAPIGMAQVVGIRTGPRTDPFGTQPMGGVDAAAIRQHALESGNATTLDAGVMAAAYDPRATQAIGGFDSQLAAVLQQPRHVVIERGQEQTEPARPAAMGSAGTALARPVVEFAMPDGVRVGNTATSRHLPYASGTRPSDLHYDDDGRPAPEIPTNSALVIIPAVIIGALVAAGAVYWWTTSSRSVAREETSRLVVADAAIPSGNPLDAALAPLLEVPTVATPQSEAEDEEPREVKGRVRRRRDASAEVRAPDPAIETPLAESPLQIARRALAANDSAACLAAIGSGSQFGALGIKIRADCLRIGGQNDDAIREYHRFCRIGRDHPAIGEVRRAAENLGAPCP